MHVTVNATRYSEMITRFMIPQLSRHKLPIRKLWFQQDGPTAHTAKKTIQLLREKFCTRIISKNAPVNWPPRSADLTAPDFFLGEFVKSMYNEPVGSLEELKQRIRKTIREIPADTLQRVMHIIPLRCQECVTRRAFE